MSFLESSSNTSKNTSSKDVKDPNFIPPERDTSSLTASKNKWTVDLRKKGAAASPSTKGKTNITNNTSNNNTNNRSSCTFSNDVFYSGKDELETIKDDAKPILKLWASRSKQNLANRNSATYKSTENVSLTNGKSEKEIKTQPAPPTKQIKTRYLSTSKTELNENGISDKKQNKENEEAGTNALSKYGRNKETYTNGDNNKDVGERLPIPKSDVPIKRVTTKSKHINSNIVTGGLSNIEKDKTTAENTDFTKLHTENTNRRRQKSPELVNEDKEENCATNESELTEKYVRGKGINKRKKNKSILEYTHLNFLKSKKTDKNICDNTSPKKSTENSIVERYTTGDCHKDQEVNIDRDSKNIPHSTYRNNINRNSEKKVTETNHSENGTAAINGKSLESNGPDSRPNLNGHSHEQQNGVHVKSRLNGHSSYETNSFNISANNSLIKKDNNNRNCRNQKFFVKSCDISLDSENEEPESSENLQTATQAILNNLNWDPTELTNKQVDNSPRYTETAVTKTTVGNGHSEEIIASYDKPLSVEVEKPLNGELMNKDYNNKTTEMSNRTYISRTTNSTSHFDDKTDTQKRLIRTSSTQIEKPTLHSRRLSNIEGSNSIDNYIRRKGSTESRNKYNTCNNGSNNNDIISTKRTFTRSQTIDIESRRYSFEKGNSDNDKSGDEFQPKSSFLRQRLKEIDNKQQQSQLQYKEHRKYSLGQQNSTYDENKVDNFLKSYRERWKSESSSVNNGTSVDISATEVNGDKITATLTELNKKSGNTELRRSSSSSSTSSLKGGTGLSKGVSVTGKQFESHQEEESDKEMNFEFRRNFSLPRDKISQNGKLPVSKQASDSSSISRFSFSSRSNSNRSSGRSNKSVSPSSSIQSLDSISSDVTSGTTLSNVKSSGLSIPSFGSITKVQPSKLSDAKELQSSFSSLRREKLKQTNSNDDCVPVQTSVSHDENTINHTDENLDEDIELNDSQTNNLLEQKSSGTKSPCNMERKSSGPKSPTSEDRRGSFSLFRGRKNSTEKTPHSKSISSYFNFKKDKVRKDGSLEQHGSPPVSPTYGASESSMSFDLGKENNDVICDPPLSPPPTEGRERRGSTLKRLFQKKSTDVASPRQSFDTDSEKKARTIAENETNEIPNEPTKIKTNEIPNEPTKIKTKLKYIDADVMAINSIVKEEEPLQPITVTSKPVDSVKNEKKSSSRVLSISARSIKKESSIDKATESTEVSVTNDIDVPDRISVIDTKSTTQELDIVQTVSKTERRSRRRDRRNQALDANEIDTVLGAKPKEDEISKTNIVPMETESESLFQPVPTGSVDVSLEEKSNANNDSETKDNSICETHSADNDNVFLSPSKDEFGSSESLYASDASTKGFSSNKERIKNRKAARLEAAERRRQLKLDDDVGEMSMTVPSTNMESMDVDIVMNGKVSSDDSPKGRQSSGTEKQSPPEVKPKKRKKHKAQRSNTEFINIPRPPDKEEIKAPLSQDDGIVMRRNNKRGQQRRDRPRTLTAGIDADMLSTARLMADDTEGGQSGVVNENMSFAEIKKKLLEGVKTEEKKEPEKVSSKNRQKIKRTKSTKRYKTITEGIAPRDLALAAQQAKEASQQAGNTIDKETLEQITASLSLASDKRKSFRVESRPGSRHQSTEDLRMFDGDIEMTPEPQKPTLQRTKSMTTLHMNIDLAKEKDEDDDEPEIKPLSELKNRFLQAMEETNKKHKEKKTVVDIDDIKRKNPRGDRANRPYTICGLDDWTMDKLMDDIGQTPDNDLQKENKENIVRKSNDSLSSDKVVNGSKTHITDEKTKGGVLAQDIINDLEDLDVSESELDELLNDKKEKDIKPKADEKSEPLPEVDLSQLDDLDFISHQSSQLSSSHVTDKRNIRPQRRHRAGNNPIKSLQQRGDLIDESEIQTKESEKQKSQHPVVDAYRGLSQSSKQNPADRLLRRTDLADEAVNALRATVDFTKTKLKKVVVAPGAVGVIEESFKPTEITNILLQIKGRRKVQTSIVKFSVESLNSNDCFIVLTPKDLLCWYGAQSNVIERAKAAEVASRLFQKKEMGCKAFDVLYVEQSGEVEKKIIRVLGGDASDKINTSRPVTNDEEYEKALSTAYMTYIVCERNDPPELIPLDSQCHRMPSKEILQTDSAFVFDFLDEVYVWLGRKTNSAQRQVIQKLAAEKFDEGYHKLDLHSSHHGIHGKTRAITTLTTEGGPHLSRRASGAARRGSLKARRGAPDQSRYQIQAKEPRPPHAILCQLFEGSEWVVFKEKFCDWPDESRIIRMKGGPESVGEITKEVSTEIVIGAVDAADMIKPFVPPKMVLEQVDIGRGHGIPKGMDGYHVVTIDVKTWHVCENKDILLPDESFGQFHSGEGYVIRWQYKIVKVRNLRNCPDISKAGGMEKCCYFFWLGNDCSVNEEGATAVMTIELDKEKGPQIRVVLGKEPPALLNIFDGSMVIHAGKRPAPEIRESYTDQSIIRLYCIRNEIPSEACLLQVPPFCESLRSRASFVLLLCQQGEVLLWHGCRSNAGTRATAEHAAKQLMANHPEEASIAHMTEIGFTVIEEGEEPEEFWILLGGKEDYGSMLDDTADTSQLSPRLFQLESATGTFIPHEIVSPSKTDLHNCPFPVLQDDLYNVDQPAIFLLDAMNHIYLWFGWWPEDLDAEANNSRRRRWDEERRKAMESAVSYATALERPLNTMYAIYAGLEPESFIELFPYWVVQDDITDLQIDEGIEEGKLYKITEELAVFTKEFYTITELRARTTPQGVDPTKLEKYLSDEDFLFLFGFTKEAFYTLPGWQQVNWKKKLGLY